MNFSYAVVQFCREGTYSEIPTLWLTKDFTQCKWPTAKNVSFFIKKNSPPEIDWLLFDIKVECHCETLEKARKIAEDANYAISCDESVGKGRGKRIRYKKKLDDIYDTCDDSEDDNDDSPPQLHKTSQKKLKADESRDSSGKKSLCDKQFLPKQKFPHEKVSEIATEKRSSLNYSSCDKSQTRINDSLQADELNDFNESLAFGPKKINSQNREFISTTSPLPTTGDIEKLLSICFETLKYVKSIDQRLKALEKNVINVEEPTNIYIFDEILPINSIESLQRFEENLENAETRTYFIQFIKKIGGKGSKNLVHRSMGRLFTNEFGKACSWRGRGSNYRMCDLKCICILKKTLKTKGLDECDFETIASEWFRFSKMRYDREIKKVLPDNPNAHEKDSSLHEMEPKFLYAEVFCKAEDTDICTNRESMQE